jgi:hypothetical protein
MMMAFLQQDVFCRAERHVNHGLASKPWHVINHGLASKPWHATKEKDRVALRLRGP